MVDMSVGVLDSEKVGAFGALLRQQDKGSGAANAEAERWRESDARLAKARRRENAAGWFSYYSHLACVFRQRAEEFEAKAEALCE